MIALVSGAAGFIGSHLVERLGADGVTVRRVQRPLPEAETYARDPIWRGVTHVFHLGGRTRAPLASDLAEANVQFTERLAQAAVAQAVIRDAPVPHFVFVSSLAALGPASAFDVPVTEQQVPAPVEAYGRSKLEAEQRLRCIADLPLTIVRPSAVYGPRDRDFLTVFRQVRHAVQWRATPGWYGLSLAFVHDVVDAILAATRVAAHESRSGPVDYLVSGHEVRWDALYEATARAVGCACGRVMPRAMSVQIPPLLLSIAGMVGAQVGRLTGSPPLATPDKIILGAQPYWVCRDDRLRRYAGWQPRVTLDAGLLETARWYVQHGWLTR